MFCKLALIAVVAHVAYGFAINSRADECRFTIGGNSAPLVVYAGTNEFVYPAPGATTITVDAGSVLDVSCPGGNLSVGATSDPFVAATCVSGRTFMVGEEQVNFDTITCSTYPSHTSRYTNLTCTEGGREVEIGYELGSDRFVRQIRLCFDDTMDITLYSEYNLTASIGAHESGVERPFFEEDSFYGFIVSDKYVRDSQRATINGLLGLSVNSSKYIHDDNDLFLARGHLTAKADFVYGYQERATMHYVNVAPEWQSFNGQNWMLVELNLRTFAENNSLNLVVYTGVYGVATLPHEETGEETELYLNLYEGKKSLPVPALYWKVAYDPATKAGVAFIGVNNPYIKDVKSMIVCEDISDSITWMIWNKTNIEQGYSYACTVDDLRKTVKFIPALDITSVLA